MLLCVFQIWVKNYEDESTCPPTLPRARVVCKRVDRSVSWWLKHSTPSLRSISSHERFSSQLRAMWKISSNRWRTADNLEGFLLEMRPLRAPGTTADMARRQTAATFHLWYSAEGFYFLFLQHFSCDGEKRAGLRCCDPAGHRLLLPCCHTGVYPVEQLQYKVCLTSLCCWNFVHRQIRVFAFEINRCSSDSRKKCQWLLIYTWKQ